MEDISLNSKSKKYKVKPKRIYELFMQISPLLILIIIIICITNTIYNSYYFRVYLNSDLVELSSTESIIYQYASNVFDTYFNYIIAIFGIIISIWLGLNIYSYTKKDEMNKLNKLLKQQIKKSIEQERINQGHLESITAFILFNNNYQAEINNPYLTYLISNASYVKFLSKNPEVLKYIIECERLFSSESQDTNILLDNYNNCLNESHKLQKLLNDKTNIISVYSCYKIAITNFKIADIYRVEKQNMLSLTHYITGYENLNKCLNVDEDFKNMDYVYDLAAITSLRIYLFLKQTKENTELANKYLNKCEDYFCKVNRTLSNCDILRHYGVYLEKKPSADYNSAILYYKKAISSNYRNYDSRYNYASLLLKMFLKTKKIDRNTDRLYEIKKTNTYKEDIKELTEIEQQLYIAKNIDSSKYSTYMKLGELYTYMMLLLKKDSEIYKQKAIINLLLAQELSKENIKVLAHTRNYYEAIDNIEKAKIINQSIKGYKDTETWELKYVNEL